MLPSVHNALYRNSYQLSMFIYEALAPEPARGRAGGRNSNQTLLEKQLSCFVVGHGNLLIACVKITTYNDPAAVGSAPFSEPWSLAQPSLLGRGSRRRHLISQALIGIGNPATQPLTTSLGHPDFTSHLSSEPPARVSLRLLSTRRRRTI